jgi:hypothetical protein
MEMGCDFLAGGTELLGLCVRSRLCTECSTEVVPKFSRIQSFQRKYQNYYITVYSPTTYTICCFQHTRFDRTAVIISVSMIMVLHYTSHHIRICALDTVIFIESTIMPEPMTHGN